MDFLDETEFNAAFQRRLLASRLALDWSQQRMALALHTTKDAYKRYESRPGSTFPLYLIPRLIYITGKPAHYWLGLPADESNRRGRAVLRVIPQN